MNSKRFRARFVLGVVAFIFGTAAIGWIVGDSILLALSCILGWLAFVGLFLGYAEKQRSKENGSGSSS